MPKCKYCYTEMVADPEEDSHYCLGCDVCDLEGCPICTGREQCYCGVYLNREGRHPGDCPADNHDDCDCHVCNPE